jgi:putative endonuclease
MTHKEELMVNCFMLPSAFVYIVTNKTKTTLYVGVTTDLPTRLWEHKTKQSPTSFTARYNVYYPIYIEGFELLTEAIKREKYIKGKTRKWKETLINSVNPQWEDLTSQVTSNSFTGLENRSS